MAPIPVVFRNLRRIGENGFYTRHPPTASVLNTVFIPINASDTSLPAGCPAHCNHDRTVRALGPVKREVAPIVCRDGPTDCAGGRIVCGGVPAIREVGRIVRASVPVVCEVGRIVRESVPVVCKSGPIVCAGVPVARKRVPGVREVGPTVCAAGMGGFEGFSRPAAMIVHETGRILNASPTIITTSGRTPGPGQKANGQCKAGPGPIGQPGGNSN